MAKIFDRFFSRSVRFGKPLHMSSSGLPEAFLPPINRGMQKLDRGFFQKTIPIAAVTVSDTKKISEVRSALTKSKEALHVGGFKTVLDDDTTPGAKCILLMPSVSVSAQETWSTALKELTSRGTVGIRPYDLKLKYEDWSMFHILEAVLPDLPEDEKETPTGFAQAGHVAHVNLREPYLQYKYLIGEVLADKNAGVTTVINKILDVGTESVFRTFPYEVLAGPNDLNVTVSQTGCEFQFDFGKVYWNTRLETEHSRLVAKFRPGEAVCDVMAGVGPFALPAGKKKVYVRANDLNPESFIALEHNIKRNKVDAFVQASCLDGREFIKRATNSLPPERRSWREPAPKGRKQSATSSGSQTKASHPPSKIWTEPPIFGHYVMNLPGSAVEFLDAFKGLYEGRESEFAPHTSQKLPMVHVYTFQAKRATAAEEQTEVCEKVSTHLGHELQPENNDLDMEIFDVRLVAPQKRMYCASFRLPPAVAFTAPSNV